MPLDNSQIAEPVEAQLQLHRRTYDVAVFMIDDRTMRLRGDVRDTKPPHLHFPEDPEELTIHHMIVDVVVDAGTTIITDVEVVFDSYPQTTCPTITEHYHELIGSSLGRGFTARIRELFGGPRGCTHTNALLLAMAPVFIQALWSLNVVNGRNDPVQADRPPRSIDAPDRRDRPDWVASIDTCHVWASDGARVVELRRTPSRTPAPRTFVERAEALGVPEEVWAEQFG